MDKAKTEQDLKKVITQTIADLKLDTELKAMYPNVIAYTTSKAYLNQIVDKVADIVVREGMTNIYEILSQIENTLFSSEE